MTLSDFANLGTLLSSIAVLVSLIYLSIQVRQAEKNQRAIINQGVATRTSEIVRWSAEPHIVALRARVVAGDTDFTAEELVQLAFTLRASIISIQDTHLQHGLGLIDQLTLETTLGGTRGLLEHPVFRALWQRMRQDFAPQTAAFIDQVIAETKLAKPVDLVARFKRDLAGIS